MAYRQVETDAGAWRLAVRYVTDPARSSLVARVRFTSLNGAKYRVYAVSEPTISGTPGNDTGRTRGHALVATDRHGASALFAQPSFRTTANGFRAVNGAWADLGANGQLDHRYRSARNGYVVQAAKTALTGRSGHQHLSLALGFGAAPSAAVAAARGSLHAGYAALARGYAASWKRYLAGLHAAPVSLTTAREHAEYRMSEMVLAASEDKIHRGAFVASPTMPWVWGAQRPDGPYHLVWSRDLYEIATALIADGDLPAANRALTFLFRTQQKSDGSFPQNSTVAGKEFWTGLQLDEVADPILLAYQLGRVGAASWQHVKAAANFLIGFSQDGQTAPWTPQERWENQSGYSPATLASEISGLVCAASIARANGDASAAATYLRHADRWRAKLKGWTVTTNGPYSPKPYFLRLSKNGDPDAGTTYSIGDSGPSAMDQRKVVDPSFLELVRLGVLPARDKDIRNTLAVIDKKLSYRTARGRFWHRASFDGYGETRQGTQWNFNNPPDSHITLGRGWPLLTGERGEYAIAAGHGRAVRTDLATMANAANGQYLLPEQVWDHRAPAGRPGFAPGTPTLSATPLAWTHAQFIRLAVDAGAGQIVEQPTVVTSRYGTGGAGS
jgi:glucoamylase